MLDNRIHKWTSSLLCVFMTARWATPAGAAPSETQQQREIEVLEMPGSAPTVFIKFKGDGPAAGARVAFNVNSACGIFEDGTGQAVVVVDGAGIASAPIPRRVAPSSSCGIDVRAAFGREVASLSLYRDNSGWPQMVRPAAPVRERVPEPTPVPESAPASNAGASTGGGGGIGLLLKTFLIIGVSLWVAGKLAGSDAAVGPGREVGSDALRQPLNLAPNNRVSFAINIPIRAK